MHCSHNITTASLSTQLLPVLHKVNTYTQTHSHAIRLFWSRVSFSSADWQIKPGFQTHTLLSQHNRPICRPNCYHFSASQMRDALTCKTHTLLSHHNHRLSLDPIATISSQGQCVHIAALTCTRSSQPQQFACFGHALV
jgi:hypothetical protein